MDPDIFGEMETYAVDAAVEPGTHQKLPRQLYPTFKASTLSRGSSTLSEGPRAVPVATANLRESNSVSRRWRVVRIMGADANAAYSECGVKFADNGSLGPTSKIKMDLD